VFGRVRLVPTLLAARSRSALAAENLFLRKQLSVSGAEGEATTGRAENQQTKISPSKTGRLINLKTDGAPEFAVWPGKQSRFFFQGDEYRSRPDCGNWRIETKPEQN
jgi:hypothetical protein